MLNEINQKALRLIELDKLVVKAIAAMNIDELVDYVSEFKNTKKFIRSYALEHPLVNMKEIENDNVRRIIQKIMSNEPFPVEMALSGGSTIKDYLKGELDEEELEDLGSKLFYSWFSHYEYIQGLYEIGALTISCGKVPANLSRFVDEARHCFTFQQYNAVFSLCRTILEVCVKDVATKHEVLPSDQKNIRYMVSHAPELYGLINQLCEQCAAFEVIRVQLHEVRKGTNSIIHGNSIVTRKEAKEMLGKTLVAAHQLYELETKMVKAKDREKRSQ